MGEDELRCILSHCDCQTLARMSSTCAWFYDIVSRTDLVSLWIDERVNALDTKFLGFHFQKKEVNLCEGIFNPIVDPVSIWGDFTRSMSIMNIPRTFIFYFMFTIYQYAFPITRDDWEQYWSFYKESENPPTIVTLSNMTLF